MVDHLRLGVTCGTKLELSHQFSPQSNPKVTQEFGFPIGYNREWNVVESHHLLDIEIHHMRCIIGLMAWDKMSHFGETVYYHHNGVFVALSAG